MTRLQDFTNDLLMHYNWDKKRINTDIDNVEMPHWVSYIQDDFYIKFWDNEEHLPGDTWGFVLFQWDNF